MGENNVQAYQCVILAGKLEHKYLGRGTYANKYGIFFFVSDSNGDELKSAAFRKREELEYRFRCRLGDPEIVPPNEIYPVEKPPEKLPTSSKFPEFWA